MLFEYCIRIGTASFPMESHAFHSSRQVKNKSFALRLGIYNSSSALICIPWVCWSYAPLYLDI